RAPHRKGRDLTRGRSPTTFPLIVQGPLAMTLRPRRFGWWPRTENAEVSAANPATVERLGLWRKAAIAVRGAPEWVFIKLHCHGMDPRDDDAMLGDSMTNFLRTLTRTVPGELGVKIHFVTAREMVNLVLAACDGRDGEPGDFRNYRLRPV